MNSRTKLLLALTALFALGGLAFFVVLRGALQSSPPLDAGLAAFDRADVAGLRAAITRLETDPVAERETALLRGALALLGGQGNVALHHFAAIDPDAPAVAPYRADLLLLMLRALYKEGRLAEARRIGQVLVAENPDDVDARRWLGLTCYDLGALTEAISHFEALVEHEPDDPGAYRLLGSMRLDFEQYAAAIDVYERALANTDPRVVPPDIRNDFHAGLGQALMGARRYEEAAAALAKVGPKSPRVLAWLADCHAALGEPARAEAFAEQGYHLGPNDPDALRVLGKLRLSQGRADAAVALLRRAVALAPIDVEAQYQLGLAYRAVGDTRQADEQIRRTQELRATRERLNELNLQAMEAPTDVAVRREIADLCDELGMPELAASWRRAADSLERLAEPTP